jgi:hypothetical protein
MFLPKCWYHSFHDGGSDKTLFHTEEQKLKPILDDSTPAIARATMKFRLILFSKLGWFP